MIFVDQNLQGNRAKLNFSKTKEHGSGMKRFLWSRCCEKEEQELVFAADLANALFGNNSTVWKKPSRGLIFIGIHFSFPSKHPG